MTVFRVGVGPAPDLLCKSGPASTLCGLDLLLSEVGLPASKIVKCLFLCSL